MFAASKTAAPAAAATYIEDVFSTWLYTGTGSAQTITNGIDLAGNGGLVWCKARSNPYDNYLFDTNRGVNNYLVSNGTGAQNPYGTYSNLLTAFNSTGFSLGADSLGSINVNAVTYASWTFRKQPKFFDVVTWTGDGSSSLAVSHSLGAKPGFIAVKRTDSTGNWWCWARASNTQVVTSGGAGTPFALNSTNAGSLTSDSLIVGAADATSFTPYFLTGFSNSTNINGATYVAYLFAHNAGGFGLTGSDNVISCGSLTTDANGYFTVNLGYEPQWLLMKGSSTTSPWYMVDNMRGWTNGSGGDAQLFANNSNAESTGGFANITSTGFSNPDVGFVGNATYIYIAIRRGPMKTPTTGTSVFAPYVTSSSGGVYNAGFVTDWLLQRNASGTDGWYTGPRLNGGSNGGYYMKTENTSAEVFSSASRWDSNIGAWNFNGSYGCYMFQRAPGFFDVVCYTGTGSATTQAHNLGVAPEMMIIKARSSGYGWPVYAAAPGPTKFAYLDDTGNFSANSTAWNDTAPTASVFTVGTGSLMNTNGVTYVAYLFASVSGVSKVGSYTGTGTTLQIDCGFTGGARFVLIKRTDSTGDWYVWDSARGIVAGNDPYLLLNSTAAEVTNTDYVDTYSAGFEISSTAPAAINANGGSFIFLAIA